MPKNRRGKNKSKNGQVADEQPVPVPAPIQSPVVLKLPPPTMVQSDVLKPIARKTNEKGQFVYVDLGKVVKNIFTNHFKIDISDQEVYRYDVEVALWFSNGQRKPIQNKERKRLLMDIAMEKRQLGYGFDGGRMLFTNKPIKCPDEMKGEHNGEKFAVVINKKTIDRPFQLIDALRDDLSDVEELVSALEIIMTTTRKLTYPTHRLRLLYYPMDHPRRFPIPGLGLWAGFYSSVKKGQWGMTLNFDCNFKKKSLFF